MWRDSISLNSNNVGKIDHKSEISDYETSDDNILNEFSQVQDQDFQLQNKTAQTHFSLFFMLSTMKTLNITY